MRRQGRRFARPAVRADLYVVLPRFSVECTHQLVERPVASEPRKRMRAEDQCALDPAAKHCHGLAVTIWESEDAMLASEAGAREAARNEQQDGGVETVAAERYEVVAHL